MPKTFEVHPSIGIARVGSSTQFFVGPEPGTPAPASYRDRRGGLLRQAARFRVYECERTRKGELVSAEEVGPRRAQVEWTVHLANAKGDADVFPPVKFRRRGGGRRNDDEADRTKLVIDPGPRALAVPGKRALFDTGQFLGVNVPLGEMRTDDDGRLLVVGGAGKADFVPRADGNPVPIVHFANNDRWYDDISDGPVTARLTFADGTAAQEAVPAWVIVGPPDFAPAVTNFVTLYDVALDVAVAQKWRSAPKKPSFTKDIQPILERAVGYQWVYNRARMGHGAGTTGEFTANLDDFADPSAPKGTRAFVVDRLRDPTKPPPEVGESFGVMPRLHDETNTDRVLPPTKTQWANLQRWVAGKFVDDRAQPPEELEPDALDRMALESCSGGPFFPGIEAGRIMADPSTYGAAFRLDTTKLAPGAITRGNAVPWQADFWACEHEGHGDLGWWPAQRPDQVRTSTTSLAMVEWDRGVGNARELIERWHKLGVVTETVDADGRRVFIETERRL